MFFRVKNTLYNASGISEIFLSDIEPAIVLVLADDSERWVPFNSIESRDFAFSRLVQMVKANQQVISIVGDK